MQASFLGQYQFLPESVSIQGLKILHIYYLHINILLAHSLEERVDGKLRDWEMVEGQKQQNTENVIVILMALTQFYLLFIRMWKPGT